MYEKLREKLILEKSRLAVVGAMFESIQTREYNPFLDELPKYNPLSTLEDARRTVLSVAHDNDAAFAFDVFTLMQEKLWNKQENIHNMMVFDHAYHYDDYPRLLRDLGEKSEEFNDLAAEMKEIFDLYKYDWKDLAGKGVISPDTHEILVANYRDTLAEHARNSSGGFDDCRKHETIAYLKERFSALQDDMLRIRVKVVALYIDRAEHMLLEMRHVYKYSDDGVLEYGRQEFVEYLQDHKAWLENIVPQLSREIFELSGIIAPATELRVSARQPAGYLPPSI